MLEAARGDDLISKRNFAIINLMARVGVRGIELERANVEDLRNKGAATVLHLQGKGRVAKDSFVVLTPAAVGPIYDYLSARRASGLEAFGPHSTLFAPHSTRTYGKHLVTRNLGRP